MQKKMKKILTKIVLKIKNDINKDDLEFSDDENIIECLFRLNIYGVLSFS